MFGRGATHLPQMAVKSSLIVANRVQKDNGNLSGGAVKFLRKGLIHQASGFIKAIHSQIGEDHVAIREAIFRVEAKSLGGSLERFIVLSRLAVDERKIIERHGVSWIGLSPRVIYLHGLVEVQAHFVVIVSLDVEFFPLAGAVSQLIRLSQSFAGIGHPSQVAL